MTHDQAEKERDKALRESQLELFHSLRETFNELSELMLGTKEWRTDLVDRELEELRCEITDHFGMEEES